MSEPRSVSGPEHPPGAIASLVCGILSIVLMWTPPVGLSLGIVAIALAYRAKRQAEAEPGLYAVGGVRVGGLVCGIVGACLSGVYQVVELSAAGDPPFLGTKL